MSVPCCGARSGLYFSFFAGVKVRQEKNMNSKHALFLPLGQAV